MTVHLGRTGVPGAAALAAAAWLALSARGEDPSGKVALKLDRRPKVGERVSVRETVRQSRSHAYREKDKPERKEEESEDRALEYEREILALEKDRIVTREKRRFSKFHVKCGADEDRSLEGKTVTITRGAGGGGFSLEGGGQPTGLARDYLAGEAEREIEHELPENPFGPPAELAPGGTWDLEWKRFVDGLGEPFESAAKWDIPASTGKGTLKRAFERDGARYAELEVKVKLKCKEYAGAPFTDGGWFQMEGTYECCADGSRPDFALAFTQSFGGTVKAEDPSGKSTIEVVMATSTKVDERRELVREKR